MKKRSCFGRWSFRGRHARSFSTPQKMSESGDAFLCALFFIGTPFFNCLSRSMIVSSNSCCDAFGGTPFHHSACVPLRCIMFRYAALCPSFISSSTPQVSLFHLIHVLFFVVSRFPSLHASVRSFGSLLFRSQYAANISQLAVKARSVVRDLDPQNELTFLRIRSKKHEIMVAPDKDFLLIIIQDPTVSNKK